MLSTFIYLLRSGCQANTHKYTYRLVGKYDNRAYSVLQRRPIGTFGGWVDVRKIYQDEI